MLEQNHQMPIKTAIFKITTEFTSAMDAIRKMGFPVKEESTTLRDAFDDKSQCVHLFLEIGGEIAVYHRFTNNLENRKLVMQHWTDDKAPVPQSEPCMEMGRFVIAPKFRGIEGLFECVILMGLIYARTANYSKVATMIKCERKLVSRCESLGFESEQLIAECNVPHSGTINACTLIYNLKAKGKKLAPAFLKKSSILWEKYKIILNYKFIYSVTPVVQC
jgi:hypothetical protein